MQSWLIQIKFWLLEKYKTKQGPWRNPWTLLSLFSVGWENFLFTIVHSVSSSLSIILTVHNTWRYVFLILMCNRLDYFLAFWHGSHFRRWLQDVAWFYVDVLHTDILVLLKGPLLKMVFSKKERKKIRLKVIYLWLVSTIFIVLLSFRRAAVALQMPALPLFKNLLCLWLNSQIGKECRAWIGLYPILTCWAAQLT